MGLTGSESFLGDGMHEECDLVSKCIKTMISKSNCTRNKIHQNDEDEDKIIYQIFSKFFLINF